MARDCSWALLGFVVVACVLPKVEVDPTLDPAGSGGTGATGGSGGTTGGSATGGTGGATGGTGGEFGEEAREFACGDYCTTYLENCRDAPPNTYDDFNDCLTTCFGSNWPFGPDNTQVNSVQCRATHAALAKDDPDPHCFHSAEVPTQTLCALPP
jgi:hypothetical protein